MVANPLDCGNCNNVLPSAGVAWVQVGGLIQGLREHEFEIVVAVDLYGGVGLLRWIGAVGGC